MYQEDVSNTESGLQTLSFRGKWESLLDKLGNLEVQQTVDKQVQQSYRLLALVRRKKYEQALEIWQEIDKKQNSSGGRLLENVPFAQLLLSWEILLHTGHEVQSTKRLDMLYCKSKQKFEDDPQDEVWGRRYGQVTCTLIKRFLEKKDYMGSLRLLNDLLKIWPQNPDLWSRSAMILLMQGAVTQATRLTKWLQETPNISWNTDTHKQETILLLQGLINSAQWDLDKALACFQGLSDVDGGKPTTNKLAAIVNEAIVRLYKEDMNRGVSMLERVLKEDIHTFCQESLVSNLCVMYEQQKTNQGSQQAKKALLDWLSLLAPQDFNMKVTRLQ